MKRELHLFAGCGGGVLGGILLGHTCVCAVEIEPYRRKALLQRQRDGFLPRFPIWDDIRTFDGRPWWGRVDVVAGGFPCTDISIAGNGAGINGEHSGLWKEMARVVREVGPGEVLVENSPALAFRGLEVVLGDLAEMGYDARWGVFQCADAAWSSGTPVADHERARIYIYAISHAEKERRSKEGGFRRIQSQERVCWIRSEVSDSPEIGCNKVEQRERGGMQGKGSICSIVQPAQIRSWGSSWWQTEPGVYGVADGVADRVDRIESIGDGQVPEVVRIAWDTLSAEFN